MAGRPATFESPEELEIAIDEYFQPMDADIHFAAPKTIAGLAYHLGFESRQSFYDYEKRDGYSYIIKRARLRIETIYEEQLSGKNPTGSIFALKNMGWTDKQEIDQKTEHSGGITITWEDPKLPDTEDKGSTGELPGLSTGL